MNSEEQKRKIEQTLSSLDGLQRATINPFLITRMEARIRQTQVSGTWVWAIGFVVAVLLITNIWTGFNSPNTGTGSGTSELQSTLSY